MSGQTKDLISDTIHVRGAISAKTVRTDSADVLAEAGALDPDTALSLISNTGAVAVTLADAAEENTVKTIVCTSATGASTLTPANFGNGDTITFDAAGEAATLVFASGSWWLAGGVNAATVA